MKKLFLISIALVGTCMSSMYAQKGNTNAKKPATSGTQKTANSPTATAPLTAAPVAPALVASSLSGTVLLKKVEAQPGKLIIPYTKYRLANGLTVLIHEDHSDPLVHVEVTYHVGSNRETPRRTGFAHFFEHMMFQGSQNVADEEHFKMIQGAGGRMNGTTNRDRTNYFETVPSNYLETCLWLEADRMGFLLPAFTQKKFEVQRSTVKNEKDQSYGSSYSSLPEVKDETLYPYGHPYSWQTIGYVDDLNEADSSDLKNFFIKWYGPNNATLVIAGDVNTEETIKMVEKYFNSINRGNEIPPLPKKPVTLEEKKVQSIQSKIFFPLTNIIFPTAHSFHADEPALDILSQLLSASRNSVLYKHFIDDETCVQANSYNATYEIAGEFNFQIVTYPGEQGGLSVKEIQDRLALAFEEFEKNGFKDEELERIKNAYVASYYSYTSTAASKANILSQYEMLMPNKDFNLQDDVDRYKKVSKEDIMRVFRKYIKDKNYACINILPHPDSYNPEKKVPLYESINRYKDETPDKSSYMGLSYNAAVDPIGFDRSKKPVPPAAKSSIIPDFFKFDLENGIKVIATKTTETPRVNIQVKINGGHLFETGKIKNGTATMLAAMLNEGTTTKTAKVLEEKMGDLSSNIAFNADDDAIYCNIECYKDKIKETMDLFQDMLMNPAFDEKEFKKQKKGLAESISSNILTPENNAQFRFTELLYGKDNPIGVSNLSSYSDVKKLSIDDLKNFHKNFLSSSLTTISLVGDIDESIKSSFQSLATWKTIKLEMPKYTKFPAPEKTKVYLMNKDNAKQSDIMIAYKSLPYDVKGEYFKASIMNFVLGGNFNSRMNLNLREDKGWTYGISSFFMANSTDYPGLYMVSAGIKTKATDSAITEVIKIIKNYIENGITNEELEFTKKSLLGGDALKYESPFSKLRFINQILDYNLDKNFNTEKDMIVKNITKEEINALIKKYLSVENIVIFVVGDDVKIIDGLNNLGYGKVNIVK